MTIHVYHPYRQPDGENFCQAVNGHCSHLCLPAPKINDRSPRISCACPTGLKLMEDDLMCVEDGEWNPISIRRDRMWLNCSHKREWEAASGLIRRDARPAGFSHQLLIHVDRTTFYCNTHRKVFQLKSPFLLSQFFPFCEWVNGRNFLKFVFWLNGGGASVMEACFFRISTQKSFKKPRKLA